MLQRFCIRMPLIMPLQKYHKESADKSLVKQFYNTRSNIYYYLLEFHITSDDIYYRYYYFNVCFYCCILHCMQYYCRGESNSTPNRTNLNTFFVVQRDRCNRFKRSCQRSSIAVVRSRIINVA